MDIYIKHSLHVNKCTYLYIYAIIQSANDGAVAQCIKLCKEKNPKDQQFLKYLNQQSGTHSHVTGNRIHPDSDFFF